MTFIIIIVVLFVLLDVAALRWGAYSSDGIDGAEWERRRVWALSHLMHHD